MATEIERKFLVEGNGWQTPDPATLIQGYLHRSPTHTVRVRVTGQTAWLAVKTRPTGFTRQEFEYRIPVDEARELLKLSLDPPIEKRRHSYAHEGHIWEIDEFMGPNKGLVVAEIELASEDATFASPPWLGPEVTADPRYLNSNLAAHPYRTWPPAGIRGGSSRSDRGSGG